MALIFSRSTNRFYNFKFRVSPSQIAATSSPMMSGPNSPDLNPLACQVGAMLESYRMQQLKPKTVSEFEDELQLIWFALPDLVCFHAVKDYRKQL